MPRDESNEIVNERPDSVEISVNAKKEISYKIKVYAEHGGQAFEKVCLLKTRMDAWIDEQAIKRAAN